MKHCITLFLIYIRPIFPGHKLKTPIACHTDKPDNIWHSFKYIAELVSLQDIKENPQKQTNNF